MVGLRRAFDDFGLLARQGPQARSFRLGVALGVDANARNFLFDPGKLGLHLGALPFGCLASESPLRNFLGDFFRSRTQGRRRHLCEEIDDGGEN
ncbi:MAG: hypothetical protein ABSF78_07210, partial [Candidatus Acidiferrales bacterium]